MRKMQSKRILFYILLALVLALAPFFITSDQKNPKPSRPEKASIQKEEFNSEQQILKDENKFTTNNLEIPKSLTSIDPIKLTPKNPKEMAFINSSDIKSNLNLTVSDNFKYQPRIDINYKFNDNRNIGRMEMFVPLWQSHKSLIFSDLRGWFDNNGTKEGNFGLGFRKIIANQLILGTYGFFDRRSSQYNNVFHQITFGGEVLTQNWDFRANLYLPQSEKKQAGADSYNNFNLVGNNLTATKSSKFESPLKGFDFEVGRKVPYFEDLRFFVGYHHFYDEKNATKEDGSKVAFKLDGYRIRADYNLYENNQNNLFLDLEHSVDNKRGENNFVGLRYRFSFGKNPPKSKISDLQKRMTNEIVRDVDIVTNSSIDQSSGKVQSAFTDSNGNVRDTSIIYVDSSGINGDGTFENPFNNLAAAQNASGEGDIIFIFNKDSSDSSNNAGLSLKDGQKVIGQGADLMLSDIAGTIAEDKILIAKTSYSKISGDLSCDGTQASVGSFINASICAGNNTVIKGIDNTNNSSSYGVSSLSKTGITISDSIVKNIYIDSNINNDSINKISNVNAEIMYVITGGYDNDSITASQQNIINNFNAMYVEISSGGSSKQENILTNINANDMYAVSYWNSTQKNICSNISGSFTPIPSSTFPQDNSECNY